MKHDDDAQLDALLDDYQLRIKSIEVPKTLEQGLSSRVDAYFDEPRTHGSQKSLEAPPHSTGAATFVHRWRWLLPSLAGSCALALVLTMSSGKNGPASTAMDHSFSDPSYVYTSTRMPIRVHSLSGGTEVHYVDSSLFSDDSGVPYLVYVEYPEER